MSGRQIRALIVGFIQLNIVYNLFIRIQIPQTKFEFFRVVRPTPAERHTRFCDFIRHWLVELYRFRHRVCIFFLCPLAEFRFIICFFRRRFRPCMIVLVFFLFRNHYEIHRRPLFFFIFIVRGHANFIRHIQSNSKIERINFCIPQIIGPSGFPHLLIRAHIAHGDQITDCIFSAALPNNRAHRRFRHSNHISLKILSIIGHSHVNRISIRSIHFNIRFFQCERNRKRQHAYTEKNQHCKTFHRIPPFTFRLNHACRYIPNSAICSVEHPH